MSVGESLNRLRELAAAMPRPGCDWESRPEINSPATREKIVEFENAAGFPLPTDLRAFLHDTESVDGMSVHNGYWLGGIGALIKLIDSGTCPREAEGQRVAPIATDGGGNVFLIAESSRVYKWNHEDGRVMRVAESFADFLERVAADWNAYISDTPGWQFLV
jgi:hypothetical protein